MIGLLRISLQPYWVLISESSVLDGLESVSYGSFIVSFDCLYLPTEPDSEAPAFRSHFSSSAPPELLENATPAMPVMRYTIVNTSL